MHVQDDQQFSLDFCGVQSIGKGTKTLRYISSYTPRSIAVYGLASVFPPCIRNELHRGA